MFSRNMVPFQRPLPAAPGELPAALLRTVFELTDDGIVLIFAFKRERWILYVSWKNYARHYPIAPLSMVLMPILFVATALKTTLTT